MCHHATPAHTSRGLCCARQRDGLTLIEILISVVIIGILAAVSVPNVLSARISGNDNTAQVLIGSAVSRMQSYYSTNNTYWPRSTQGGVEQERFFTPGQGGEFIPGLSPPKAYAVYVLSATHNAAGIDQERYCLGIQHHQGQSNAWFWTSGTAAEHDRFDRTTFTDFESFARSTCEDLIAY